jgi:hypothetical protein
MFQGQCFGLNMSMSLQTTLAAEAHLAEGQFVLEEQTLNIQKSLTVNNIVPKLSTNCDK